MLRYAAIDVGSNAVRLLIADITQTEDGYGFKKNTLVRVPLRLGDDAFLEHKISPRKIDDLLKTMSAFKNLMEVYQVSAYLACATSAMREAENGKEVINVQIGSPEWTELLNNSKFKTWKAFAAYPKGHIALQSHGAVVAYKNIKIKQL